MQTTAKLTHLNIKHTPPTITDMCGKSFKEPFVLYVSHRKTKSFLNQFKTIVVVHALLPIKPISKLDR